MLEVDPIPKYSQKAIYRLWAEQKSKEWKRDPDELKSAKILIDEASKDRSSLYSVESIPLHEEEGFTAIAFALPEMLRQWGGRIREIALDSTCRWINDTAQIAQYSFLIISQIIQTRPNTKSMHF